jgi:hypothetical protein
MLGAAKGDSIIHTRVISAVCSAAEARGTGQGQLRRG